MRTLRTLSAIYLLTASVFGVAIAIQYSPDWARAMNRAGHALWPALQQAAGRANEQLVKPGVAYVIRMDKSFFDSIDPPKRGMFAAARPAAGPVPVTRPAPVVLARPAPATTEEPARVAAAAPPKPAITLAPQSPPPVQNTPAPDASAPSPAELTRVSERLKVSLTQEMLSNFELFLYVSKADTGPWAQRMYVFQKQASGDLNLLYNWPVSTGREELTPGPTGRLLETHTPDGYYQLDPDRMYTHHFSGEWHQPMPHAMFFNWVKNGNQTGLAIHGAPDDDVALLGKRASAGCVRLAPENAALLFQLIRTQYRGLAPRFAYDRRTGTMSNEGILMHDPDGHVQLADGYKVLIFIENYGGDNVVAALY